MPHRSPQVAKAPLGQRVATGARTDKQVVEMLERPLKHLQITEHEAVTPMSNS